jgi:hypothetical protein
MVEGKQEPTNPKDFGFSCSGNQSRLKAISLVFQEKSEFNLKNTENISKV